jgi:hypothetical protein
MEGIETRLRGTLDRIRFQGFSRAELHAARRRTNAAMCDTLVEIADLSGRP